MKELEYKTEICVVGLGPAGIGTAITFKEYNLLNNVLYLEIGNKPNDRYCSLLSNQICAREIPCQMISGFGGCSLLSGSKLSLLPAGGKLIDITGSKDLVEKSILKALEFFNKYLILKKPEIAIKDIIYAENFFGSLGFKYKYYDAYLFNQEELNQSYQKIYKNLKQSGATILLNTELIDVSCGERNFKLIAKKESRYINIIAKYLILGIGRLGKNLLRNLNIKLNLGGKENFLDIGVRLEFPINLYQNISKYHYDLKLLFNDARTFCVCSGGKVAHYLLNDIFFTEGYFNPIERTNFTNLGILIRLKPSTENELIIKEVVEKIIKTSSFKPLYQNLYEYLKNKNKNPKINNFSSNSINYSQHVNLNKIFPRSINNKIKEAVTYFSNNLLKKSHFEEVNVFAPELDYVSMLFPVNTDFSIKPRIYLIGDCIGKFRGILQAFSSGVLCAENIINNKK